MGVKVIKCLGYQTAINLTVVQFQRKAREVCKNANKAGDAVRQVAKVLFTKEELLSCTVRGRHTNKTVEQRTALDDNRLKCLICKYLVHCLAETHSQGDVLRSTASPGVPSLSFISCQCDY